MRSNVTQCSVMSPMRGSGIHKTAVRVHDNGGGHNGRVMTAHTGRSSAWIRIQQERDRGWCGGGGARAPASRRT